MTKKKRARKSKAPRTGEVPFMDCVKCRGSSGKQRYSNGSATCRDGACRRLYTNDRKLGAPAELAARGQAQLAGQDEVYMKMLMARCCYSIVEIYAVSFVAPDPSALGVGQLINGVAVGNFKYHYLVRGGFGQGLVGETYLPGTRWVELHELRRCCTPGDKQGQAGEVRQHAGGAHVHGA